MARRGRRGEGTVYYSKRDRRWIARWPLGVVDGKRQDKRVKCRTRDEADDELVKLRRIYGAGGTPANDTLGAYLTQWLPTQRQLSDSARRSYEGHIRLHIDPFLGGIPLAKLQKRDIERFLGHLEHKRHGKDKRPYRPGTVILVMRTLSAALHDAIEERTILDNPMRGVKLPDPGLPPVEPLTAEGADALRAAVAGSWLAPIVRVLLGSGLRLGELCGLDQRDVVLADGFVRLRRSKTDIRAVPVSDDAIAALREALADAPRRGLDEPVFFGPRRNRAGHRERLAGSSVSHALPELLKAAGLGHLAPHALRHGAATLMLTAGHPLRVIQEQLGHRSQYLTRRYAHVVPSAQRSAVASLEPARKR